MSYPTKYIDLSHSLNSTVQIYPSDPEFSIQEHASHLKDGYSVHKLSLGTHTGTHIDAPYHFFADGETVEKIPLENLVGPAVIIDLSGRTPLPDGTRLQPLEERETITWDHLKPFSHLLQPECILLINTGWSKLRYTTSKYMDHPYIAPIVASELIVRGIRVIGIDTLSPDETPSLTQNTVNGFGFHENFLGAGGLIAENMTNLEELIDEQKASPGTTWIVNLIPLKITGADGSPIRAFANNLGD